MANPPETADRDRREGRRCRRRVARAGRPVEYCSTRCRRAREYAIARAQRAAERAERELTDARRDEAVGRGWMTSPKHVAFWAAEVERTVKQLDALLD